MPLSPAPLFEPFSSEKLELKNRIIMAPMTRNRCPEGIPTKNVAAYYRRRAENDVGLVITEATLIPHPASNGYTGVPEFYGEAALAGWKNVVDEVHAAGGKIIPQLWHVGVIRKPGLGPDPDVPGHSPSGISKPGGKVVAHEMTKQDIRETVQAYATAARSAKELGFDGVEIHGAHGYLIDQFFWEGLNQRTDEYGGSMENRSRFAIEVIEAVRKEVGDDFPLLFRISQWKQQDYTAKLAKNPEELEKFLIPLSEAGVDIFHCSTRRYWEPEFDGSDLNLAGWTKQITGKPSITVGSVGLHGDFTDAATFVNEIEGIDDLIERFNRQEFDLVAVGRALLNDPEWATKLKEGQYEQMAPYSKQKLAEELF